jgi:predicted NAD/FAD-dependent oxidoreductase
LDQRAAWVQQQMHASLAQILGQPVDWQHGTVHRWRYASPQAHGRAPAPSFGWDAANGTGVCGDFFGASGKECDWLLEQSMCTAML